MTECYDQQQYSLQQHQACTCTTYRPEPVDRWSHCILNPGQDQGMKLWGQSVGWRGVARLGAGSGYCGVGRRYQAKICRGSDGTFTSTAVCSTSGETHCNAKANSKNLTTLKNCCINHGDQGVFSI